KKLQIGRKNPQRLCLRSSKCERLERLPLSVSRIRLVRKNRTRRLRLVPKWSKCSRCQGNHCEKKSRSKRRAPRVNPNLAQKNHKLSVRSVRFDPQGWNPGDKRQTLLARRKASLAADNPDAAI